MDKLPTMKKALTALALLLLMSGSALADEIKIESVSYHGDTNTVKTNRASTKVKITRVDSAGNFVESWTKTTDGEGKITITSGYMLIKEELKAEVVPEAPQMAQGVVLPDEIGPGEPLSFAVTGGETVEGEVVTVQTAEGMVVQQARADKYGRVFLAAGLPAGAYLVTLAARDGQPAQPAGKVQVKQRRADALDRPWEQPPQPMQLRNAPRAIKLGEPLSLAGHGFSPNCADMQINFTGAGQTQSVPVLAATEDQLKLAPVEHLPPGVKELSVINKATGQSTEPAQVLIYDMQGHLERRKLVRGDQTLLELNFEPKELAASVGAEVVSGPVHFQDGSKQVALRIQNGAAQVPVLADRNGLGPFKLAWTLQSVPLDLPRPAETEGPPADHDPALCRQDEPCKCKCDKITYDSTPSIQNFSAEPSSGAEQMEQGGNKLTDEQRRLVDNTKNIDGWIRLRYTLSGAEVTTTDGRGEVTVTRYTHVGITEPSNIAYLQPFYRRGDLLGYTAPAEETWETVESHRIRCPESATFKSRNYEVYIALLDTRADEITVTVGDMLSPCNQAVEQKWKIKLTWDKGKLTRTEAEKVKK